MISDTMIIIRLFIALLSLGLAACLGFAAYNCWAVSIFLGVGDLNFLGLTISFPLGMILLVTLTLLFAFAGLYALAFNSPED